MTKLCLIPGHLLHVPLLFLSVPKHLLSHNRPLLLARFEMASKACQLNVIFLNFMLRVHEIASVAQPLFRFTVENLQPSLEEYFSLVWLLNYFFLR